MRQVRDAANLLLIGLAWLVTAALAAADLYAIRGALLRVFLLLRVGKYALGAVDKWSVFALGLVWLAAVLYAQDRYAEAGGKSLRLLLGQFAKTTLVQLVILGAAMGVRLLLA